MSKEKLFEKLPNRARTASKGAAVGAGLGALVSRKSALLGGAVGAYLGYRPSEDDDENHRSLKERLQ